ncbi:hypothetical protein [Cellulosimicrobium cellulans]|uniref:hypothetical protein n=1 Tax=Cellulosimicrobium cellulans TaxID=1710 RepID=UPI003C331B57
MSAIILSQLETGSAPATIAASVTPQKLHTAAISGIDGIGTASAPTARKPATIGSSAAAVSAAAVSAGGRLPASYSASCASSVDRKFTRKSFATIALSLSALR